MMVWMGFLFLIGLVIVGLYVAMMRLRRISFHDGKLESQRAFHRARLEELPQLIEEGLVEPEQSAAIERESKQDLLRESDQIDGQLPSAEVAQPSGWSRLLVAVGVCFLALLAFSELGGGLGRVQDVRWTEALEQLDLTSPGDVERAHSMMTAWLDDDPDNESVRMFLAELSLNLGRYQEAADGFSALSRLYPADGHLREQSIEARYLALDRRLDEALARDLDLALGQHPRAVGLLEIAGMEAHKAGRLRDAITFFKRAAQDATGPRRLMIEQILTVLDSSGSTEPPQPAMLSGADAGAPTPGVLPEIEVTVELISDQPLPTAAKLFVFARASEGPPMPLAVVRAEPTRGRSIHRLTDAIAMMPSLRLSQFDVVDVVARLSLSGQISDDGDDFETKAEKLSLAPGVQSLSLVLDLTQAEAKPTEASR